MFKRTPRPNSFSTLQSKPKPVFTFSPIHQLKLVAKFVASKWNYNYNYFYFSNILGKHGGTIYNIGHNFRIWRSLAQTWIKTRNLSNYKWCRIFEIHNRHCIVCIFRRLSRYKQHGGLVPVSWLGVPLRYKASKLWYPLKIPPLYKKRVFVQFCLESVCVGCFCFGVWPRFFKR